MALRDLIAADMAAILSDSDEFGGTVVVDGVEVPGALDEDTTGAAPRTSAARGADGVSQETKVLYVQLADPARGIVGLAAAPVVGQRMIVDGDRYTVAKVPRMRQAGGLAIDLTWWEG